MEDAQEGNALARQPQLEQPRPQLRPRQPQEPEWKRQRRPLQQVPRQLTPVLHRPRYELPTWDSGQGFPPGFRFCPTDLELLEYLKEQVKGEKITLSVFQHLDLYAHHPAVLLARFGNDHEEVFVFTGRDRKYAKGDRPSRTADAGYWKATAAETIIRNGGGEVAGKKMGLCFYNGVQRHGQKTDWLMREYTITESRQPPRQNNRRMMLDTSVLCKVYLKRNGMKEGQEGAEEGHGTSKRNHFETIDPNYDASMAALVDSGLLWNAADQCEIQGEIRTQIPTHQKVCHGTPESMPPSLIGGEQQEIVPFGNLAGTSMTDVLRSHTNPRLLWNADQCGFQGNFCAQNPDHQMLAMGDFKGEYGYNECTLRFSSLDAANRDHHTNATPLNVIYPQGVPSGNMASSHGLFCYDSLEALLMNESNDQCDSLLSCGNLNWETQMAPLQSDMVDFTVLPDVPNTSQRMNGGSMDDLFSDIPDITNDVLVSVFYDDSNEMMTLPPGDPPQVFTTSKPEHPPQTNSQHLTPNESGASNAGPLATLSIDLCPSLPNYASSSSTDFLMKNSTPGSNVHTEVSGPEAVPVGSTSQRLPSSTNNVVSTSM